MNRKDNSVADTDDVEVDIEPVDQVVDTSVSTSDEALDNVGDISVEIDVEELLAKIESDSEGDMFEEGAVRRKLDNVLEQGEREHDSTYNFNLDDDLGDL